MNMNRKYFFTQEKTPHVLRFYLWYTAMIPAAPQETVKRYYTVICWSDTRYRIKIGAAYLARSDSVARSRFWTALAILSDWAASTACCCCCRLTHSWSRRANRSSSSSLFFLPPFRTPPLTENKSSHSATRDSQHVVARFVCQSVIWNFWVNQQEARHLERKTSVPRPWVNFGTVDQLT
jgi:hypothetical protein